MRNIDTVNYFITNQCNLSCVDCAHNNPERMKDKSLNKFINFDYIYESAKYFKGMRIKLTGGEPTFHPLFNEIASKFREIFNPSSLDMDTNGYKCLDNIESLKYFDKVLFSHYIQGEYFNHNEDNTHILKELKKRTDISLIVFDINTFESRINNNHNPCYRGTELGTVSYIDGLIYPCCIGVGNKRAVGMKPILDWKSKILEVPLDCTNYLFAIE